MPRAKTSKPVSRVINAIYSEVWAIHPPALEVIESVLAMAEKHQAYTPEELRALVSRDLRAKGGILAPMYPEIPSDDGPYQVVEGVAILPLHGTLTPRASMFDDVSGCTSTESFCELFQMAMADPNVTSIVIDADSPGGSASGNEEAAAMIRGARGRKPMCTVATGICASAAYFIGSAATEFVVSPSAEVGSIGVYAIHRESSAAYKAAGVTRSVIRAGKNKALDTDAEPLSDQGRANLQERVDSLYSQFVSAVALNRGVSNETVVSRMGDGKVFLGQAAVSAGLADRVGTLQEVVAEYAAKYAHQAVVEQPAARQTRFIKSEARNVNPLLRAALVQRGLISEAADEATAQQILKTVCMIHGFDADSDPAALAQKISGPSAVPAAAAPPVAPITAATPVPTGPTPDQIRAAERARIEEIRAAADLLRMSTEHVQAAIDAGTEAGDVMRQWTRELASMRQPVARVVAGETSQEKFSVAATEALSSRIARLRVDPAAMSQGGRELRYAPLRDICRMAVEASGTRTAGMAPEDIVLRALEGAGGTTVIRAGGAEGGGYNRPSDFPNILSAIMNKIMDMAVDYTPATYRNWAAEMPAVPDFKPRTMMRIGEFGEFPRVPDSEDFTGSTVSEEANWFSVDRYGHEWSLTPRMIADDDLGQLDQVARDAIIAHDLTLNRLALNLMTGNATAGDGVALFHSNHANDGTPGVPSQTTLSEMRKLLRKQTGVSAQRKLNLTVKGILIPEDLETTVQQLLTATISVVPVTTATGEVFRGAVDWWVDPQMADASTTQYFGFADKNLIHPIVYMFQQGFENMRATTYYNNKNGCRVYQFEGRFGVGVANWRGVIRNTG